MAGWTGITAGDFGWDGKLRIVQDGVAVDISSYTTRQFILRKPDGTVATKTASFDTDGINGVLKYLFLAGDIDQDGIWYVQARVAKTGAELTSAYHRFGVGKRLEG